MARDFARRALPIVCALFLFGLLGQIYLAGMGVFDGPASFITHRNVGYTLGMITLVILILAIVARPGRLVLGLSVLLLIQFALQSLFVAVRVDSPAIAALHPVNGVLIILVVAVITVRTWRIADVGSGRIATTGSGQRSHDSGMNPP
jgi:hypothetical protein